MNQKIKMLIQELKIHMYGMMKEFYRCRTLRHQYNVDKMTDYAQKVNDLALEYGKLTGKEP